MPYIHILPFCSPVSRRVSVRDGFSANLISGCSHLHGPGESCYRDNRLNNPPPAPPASPLTWCDRRGERRSCGSGREQPLPDEESAGVTGGESGGVSARLLRSRLRSLAPVMPALHPSSNDASRPSDNASSRLSRNCCAPPSGHTSARPLRSRLPLPPPVTPVLSPSGNACDCPPVTPALAPAAMPALALSRDFCALLSGHASARHACVRLLQSRLRSPPSVTPPLPRG